MMKLNTLYPSKSANVDPALPTLALVYADPQKGKFPLQNAYPRYLQQMVGQRAHYKYTGVAQEEQILEAIMKSRKSWPYALTLVHLDKDMSRSTLLTLESDLVKQGLSNEVVFVKTELKCPPTEIVPTISYKTLGQMGNINREEICAQCRPDPEPSLSKKLTGVLYSFLG